MSTSRPTSPAEPVTSASIPQLPATNLTGPHVSTDLAAERERLQQAEQREIDREKQAELARLRELARFD